jgi:hypothetical protein
MYFASFAQAEAFVRRYVLDVGHDYLQDMTEQGEV